MKSKETVNVISSYPPCKDVNAWFTTVRLKALSAKCASYFNNPQKKINNFKKQKYGYIIHTWSDKALNGTVVLSSLHGEGSPEIKLVLVTTF